MDLVKIFRGNQKAREGNRVLVTEQVEEACEPGRLCKSKDRDTCWGLFLKFKEHE